MLDILDVIDRQGQVRPVPIAGADSLMHALRSAGLPVAAICDGAMSCGTCHVYIEQAPQLAATDEDELDLLPDLEGYDEARSRLSCQVPVAAIPPEAIVRLAPEGL